MHRQHRNNSNFEHLHNIKRKYSFVIIVSEVKETCATLKKINRAPGLEETVWEKYFNVRLKNYFVLWEPCSKGEDIFSIHQKGDKNNCDEEKNYLKSE